MHLWLENGATLAWLVDPIDRSIAIYRSNALHELTATQEIVLAGAPVEGFGPSMARLW